MHVMQLFDMKGKTALVTGGSRGLGLEIAEGFGEAGASVVITARRRRWLDEAGDQLSKGGIECLALEADVADAGQVQAAVRRTVEQFGKIDVLVNCAGVAWGALAEDMPLDKWRLVLDVNLTGAFLMAQAAGRQMIRQGGGKIVNVASIAGLVGTPPEILSAVGYSSAKAGLIGLTRDLAVKWARHGIRVNAVAPGYFATRMTEAILERSLERIEKGTPVGRIGKPGELKGAVLFLGSSASDYITGQILAVDGGAAAQASCL